MDWVYLLLAGLLEMGWPVATKFAWAGGKLKPGPALAAVALMVASMGLLLLAQRTIPIGTAYAVWTGIGSVGAVVVGIALFGEPATAARLLFVSLIVAGVVGLKLTSGK
jgi:quaternary ammonium compound-resistance protein SugE